MICFIFLRPGANNTPRGRITAWPLNTPCRSSVVAWLLGRVAAWRVTGMFCQPTEGVMKNRSLPPCWIECGSRSCCRRYERIWTIPIRVGFSHCANLFIRSAASPFGVIFCYPPVLQGAPRFWIAGSTLFGLEKGAAR